MTSSRRKRVIRLSNFLYENRGTAIVLLFDKEKG